MSDFESLNPEMRSYALVGKFLFEWAVLEAHLRDAIAHSLDLDPLQSGIVNANIQFRDKIHILKTAVFVSPAFSEEEKKSAIKTLDKISDFSSHRNMIAHNGFIATPEGHVQFMVIVAKGAIKVPEIIWSIKDFQFRYDKINELSSALKEITRKISVHKLAQAIMAERLAPTGAFGALGMGGLLQLSPAQEQEHSDNPNSTLQEPLGSDPSDRE